VTDTVYSCAVVIELSSVLAKLLWRQQETNSGLAVLSCSWSKTPVKRTLRTNFMVDSSAVSTVDPTCDDESSAAKSGRQ
jgi:hypothetical protein